MEIAPDIHRITCRFGQNRMVFVYLLIGETTSLLVDTGCAHNPQQDILPYMARLGFDPQRLGYILITHSDTDHQGGTAPMKRAAPEARLLAHRLDQSWIERAEALIQGRYSQFEQDHGIGYGEDAKVAMRADLDCAPLDMALEGGETLRLSADWQVELLHTPGHTWGHMALYDPRSRTLISGEASMSTHIPHEDWTPAMPPTYCYVETYLSTQARLLGLEIDLLASAHWPLQRGPDVGAFIRQGRDFVLHVEARLLALAQRGPFTLRQAIESLAPSLGDWPAQAHQELAYGMAGNLARLAQRGLLSVGRSTEGLTTWQMA
jgi:glyoxylase-like metal-dependent hydrolase (beta-lactamase superfamily II)